MSQCSLACSGHILGTVQVWSPEVVMGISRGCFGVSSIKRYLGRKGKSLRYTEGVRHQPVLAGSIQRVNGRGTVSALIHPPFMCLPFAFCLLTFTENPILWWCKAQGGAKFKEEEGEDFGPRNTRQARGKKTQLMGKPTGIIPPR